MVTAWAAVRPAFLTMSNLLSSVPISQPTPKAASSLVPEPRMVFTLVRLPPSTPADSVSDPMPPVAVVTKAANPILAMAKTRLRVPNTMAPVARPAMAAVSPGNLRVSSATGESMEARTLAPVLIAGRNPSPMARTMSITTFLSSCSWFSVVALRVSNSLFMAPA